MEGNNPKAFSYSEVVPYINNIRAKKGEENETIGSNSTIKDYIIVWLDSNIDQNILSELQQVVNTIKTFIDPNECINFIEQIKSGKVFLIVSYDFYQEIVQSIGNIRHLQSIYVFDDDQSWT